jgi:hypothetical protein
VSAPGDLLTSAFHADRAGQGFATNAVDCRATLVRYGLLTFGFSVALLKQRLKPTLFLASSAV